MIKTIYELCGTLITENIEVIMTKVIDANTNQEIKIEYTKIINGNKLYKVEPLNNDPKLRRWVYKLYDYTVAIFHNDGSFYYEIYYEKNRVFSSLALYDDKYEISDVVSVTNTDVINLKNNNKKIINLIYNVKKDDWMFINYKNYDSDESKKNALIKLDMSDLNLLRKILNQAKEMWYDSNEDSRDEGAYEVFKTYEDLYFGTYLYVEDNEYTVTLQYNFEDMEEIMGLLEYETHLIIKNQREKEKYLEELDSVFLKIYPAYKERKKFVNPILEVIE